jgi:hypothetical protein
MQTDYHLVSLLSPNSSPTAGPIWQANQDSEKHPQQCPPEEWDRLSRTREFHLPGLKVKITTEGEEQKKDHKQRAPR